jgi:hypothetical protein
MASNYPELDELNEAFLKVLRADAQPLSNSALLWHELIDINKKVDPPKVRSRGDAFLLYLNGHATLKEVPGQQFPKEKLPHRVCTNVMAQHSAAPEGPRFIAFRYDRSPEGLWFGGCRIETVQQYAAQVKGRAAIDEKLTEALRKHFAEGIESVGITYGLKRWTHPGPQLRIEREELTWSDLDSAAKQAWDEAVAYLEKCGMQHLYSAELKLEKPTSRLREGSNAQFRYSV